VRNLERLLVEQFAFLPANLQPLRNEEVTKQRVRRGWDWLLEDAAPGDRLVFHFSGHGSFTTDLDDDEADGVDELLCLHDMDWDDDQTYITDDELRAFTERVPPGVLLTVLLDSCHSGTGTRMLMAPGGVRSLAVEKQPLVDITASMQRMELTAGTRGLRLSAAEAGGAVQRLLSPRSDDDDRRAVLVRYVEPPAKVAATLHRGGVRSGFRSFAARGAVADMNHVLWTGSNAQQTSADAFLDGEYHGAFTFYFCQTVRQTGAGVDHQDLIQGIRSTLLHHRFSQTPQLEPATAAGPLFQWRLPGIGQQQEGQQDGQQVGQQVGQQSGQQGGGSPPSPPSVDVLEELILKLEELRRRLAAQKTRVGPAADTRVIADIAARFQQVLGTFADRLGAKLENLLDDLTSLEVSTFACDALEPGSDALQRLMARTVIKPDGDTEVYVPRKAGKIDKRLWRIHCDAVKQAAERRAERLAAVVSALAELASALKAT
jgi:hypothetical protein